eukprot:5101915-Pleurochrysis_carterae.AAC.1
MAVRTAELLQPSPCTTAVAMDPMPVLTSCSAPNSSKVCDCPAANAASVIVAVLAIHLAVNLFNCARPGTGLDVLSSSVPDSEKIRSAGFGEYSGVAKGRIGLAFVEPAFAAAAAAFAGTDAGIGRATGTGVAVVSAYPSIASRTRCLHTSRSSWDRTAPPRNARRLLYTTISALERVARSSRVLARAARCAKFENSCPRAGSGVCWTDTEGVANSDVVLSSVTGLGVRGERLLYMAAPPSSARAA